METVMGLVVGVSLSAACGFRVFVPGLMAGIAAKAGHLTLAPGFEWVGSDVALAMFAAATLVEVLGYLIPIVDHALDVAAVPLSGVAGTLLTASQISGGMSPMLCWALAFIAGGGAAVATSSVMGVGRAAVTATTGGIGNPVFAVFESLGAMAAAVAAVVAPVLALFAIATGLILLFRLARRIRRRLAAKKAPVLEPV
jgi:hypothetical protein